MHEPKSLLATLSVFAETLTGSFPVADVLYDLADQVAALLGILGAGVSLAEGHNLRFITTPSEKVGRMERSQEQYQQGPCVDAFREGVAVVVNDLSEDGWSTRWPHYVAQARAEGISSVAGLPLLGAEGCLGSMDVYSSAPHEWSEEELLTATAMATMATGYVRHASELDQQRRLAEQLQYALDSRIIIEQAKGVLANAMDISVERAFRVLRSYSRRHNASLREVAGAVVTLGLRIPEEAIG